MEEEKGRKKNDPKKYPYLRIHFSELEKMMNLKEFELNDNGEDRAQNYKPEELLTVRQIMREMDTLGIKTEAERNKMKKIASGYFHYMKTSDSVSFFKPMPKINAAEVLSGQQKEEKEEKRLMGDPPEGEREKQGEKNNSRQGNKEKRQAAKKQNKKTGSFRGAERNRPNESSVKPVPKTVEPINPMKRHFDDKLLGNPGMFMDVFQLAYLKQSLSRVKSNVESIKGRSKETGKKISDLDVMEIKHAYQFHIKISMAVACLVFLFIGAPLGTIIRKGGFGVPILFGVILFVLFIVAIMISKKSAEAGTIPPWLGAWMPILIYTIPCILVTRWAMRDGKMMNLDTLGKSIQNFLLGGKSK